MRGADTWTMSSTSSTVIARRVCACACVAATQNAKDAKTAKTLWDEYEETFASFASFAFQMLLRERRGRRKVIRYYYLMTNDFETVILSACRTPIGAFGGVFKELSAVDLGAI